MRPARPTIALLARYGTALWPRARRELRRWHRHAAAIPDPRLRDAALETLRDEHLNAEGAALLATLAPRAAAPAVVRAAVAYQTLYDYLDTITEAPDVTPDETLRLHAALLDALDPFAPAHDHDGRADRDYLDALATRCRDAARTLPAHCHIASRALASADLSRQIQAANHAPEHERAQRIRAWAADHPDPHGLDWFEAAAAASATLTVHVLLALAADPHTTPRHAAPAARYGHLISALTTLLESANDLPHDRHAGTHSYIAYYPTWPAAADRIALIATTARTTADTLPHAPKLHTILAGIAAFYASAPTATHAPATAATNAVGPPTQALTAILRLRRREQPPTTTR